MVKCTKFNFAWGSAPDPAWRAYSAPQTPSWFSGGLLPSGGRGREEREGREGINPSNGCLKNLAALQMQQ